MVPPLPMPSAFAKVSEPSVAALAKRLVDEAVVEKRFVVVAFARMVLPVAVKLVVEAPPFAEKRPLVTVEEEFARKPAENVCRFVHVLAPESEAPVERQLPLIEKQPARRLKPLAAD